MFRFFSLFLIRSATTFPYGQPCRETLINSSFRAKRCGNPESGCYDSISNWIPAFAGMTEKIIRVSLARILHEFHWVLLLYFLHNFNGM